MKFLVTGGTGYIGSHLCVELLKHNHEVVIIDNLSNSSEKVVDRISSISGASPYLYVGDIRDSNILETVFTAHRIDVVFHLGGLKTVEESILDPLQYFDCNVSGTINLLKAMERAGVHRLVFSSSATVYGDAMILPISESAPTFKSKSPYGNTKLISENILTDLSKGIRKDGKGWQFVILRYFNPVGAHESGLIGEDPRGTPSNLMPYIQRVAIGKLPALKIYGNDYPTEDGTGLRDYIHVVDLARGHVAALNLFAELDEFEMCAEKFNLGTGKGYTVLQVLRAFEKAIGRQIPYVFQPRRDGDVAMSFADPGLAKRRLGWSAVFDIDKMCSDAWRWQIHNPDGYTSDS